jgi:hypothetical protein
MNESSPDLHYTDLVQTKESNEFKGSQRNQGQYRIFGVTESIPYTIIISLPFAHTMSLAWIAISPKFIH